LDNSSPFVVYNASAGSGKTFTLVKSFLIKMLVGPYPDYFKHLLAITFTNKAVAEMKSRILKELVLLSQAQEDTKDDMLQQILNETSLSVSEIQQKATLTLTYLLNNYALLSVETIDHFNHRLLRTFSRDLQLTHNFEVSLDVPLLLSEAVDQLVEKAGEDPTITPWLLQFALQKTEEDKSWDITFDLNKVAQLLTQENDALELEKLRGKPLSDFEKLKEKLLHAIRQREKEAQKLGQEVCSLLESHQLDRSHFVRGSLFDFFQRIAEGNLTINDDPSWYQKIAERKLYPARVTSAEAAIIDTLTISLKEAYEAIKERVFSSYLYQNILKNLVPLATVHMVDQELAVIKEAQNVLPISEFNNLIYKEIKDQPAPFIYERLGERYHHFFMDEFQDTSLLQWQNMIPLIDNSLSQSEASPGTNSLMIVGDAKQSIYRWRGGLPEQFISLFTDKNPFPSVAKEVVHLETNYRSCETLVQFNNEFFRFAASFFGNPLHRELYEKGNTQKPFKSCEGYVELDFIEAENKEESVEAYTQKSLEIIQELLQQGYKQKDICVLTRKKKEGIAISELLSEHHISVISEETLLLKSASKVNCLVNLLKLHLTPKDEEVKLQVLDFLYDYLAISEDKHDFFREQVGKPLEFLSESLRKYQIELQFQDLNTLTLFGTFEYFIHQLHFFDNDAFLTQFMDLVFQFSKKPMSSKWDFLDYWELQQDKASLAVNNSVDAVSIMTIHKSKGLEFPVVVFPFAEVALYREQDAKAWFPYHEEGFEELLINFNKEVENYGATGAEMFQERRNTLELDNLNLMYVAFTRAKEALYVVSKKEKDKKSPTTYSDYLKLYLQQKGIWQETILKYSFGEKPTSIDPKPTHTEEVSFPYFNSLLSQNVVKFARSFESMGLDHLQESIQFGNELHDLLSKIEVFSDMEKILGDFKEQHPNYEASQWEALQKMLLEMMDHPLLSPLFSGEDKVLNERDIISKEGVLRPDRINIHSNNSITIVDYKTGVQEAHHILQLNRYATVLSEMGFSIKEQLIVYLNPDGIVINKA